MKPLQAAPKKPASRRDATAVDHKAKIVPRDLDMLFEIFVHGPLRNCDVRALVSPTVTQRQVSERLKVLCREPNAYLYCG